MAIINMQTMRYINILDKTTRVKTRKCFIYNNTIFFAVPKPLVSRAIGPAALNVKKIQEKLGKKIKIISEPNGIGEIDKFLDDIISPVKFKSLEVKDNEIIITAGNTQSKASLIGRNRRRFVELDRIFKDNFNLDLKII